MKRKIYVPENLQDLLNKRIKASYDDRLLYVYYSHLYKDWSIYVAFRDVPLHPSLKGMSAEKLLDWLNNPNYTVEVL